VILPPHGIAPADVQTPANPDGVVEWLRWGIAAALGFLASFIGFRTRLYALKRDIGDRERAHEALERKVDRNHAEMTKLVQDAVTRLEKAFREGRTDGAVLTARDANQTRDALNAIRTDNNDHHRENRERLRIFREQMFTILRLVVKVARVIPGMNQTEVDDANAHFLALEVERGD
jgi:Mg2+ and Co2+ transporter CorA